MQEHPLFRRGTIAPATIAGCWKCATPPMKPASTTPCFCAINGTYYAYRIFHAGMATPVPVANGGTGASSAKAALNSLGIFYAATLPSTGTDGQICLVPV